MSGHTKKYHQNIIATILKETTIYVALFLHSINIVKFIKKVQETLFSLISLKHNDKGNFKYYIKITGFWGATMNCIFPITTVMSFWYIIEVNENEVKYLQW